MLATAQLVAILCAGVALYLNVAAHPARMALDTRHAALQWAPRALTLAATWADLARLHRV